MNIDVDMTPSHIVSEQPSFLSEFSNFKQALATNFDANSDLIQDSDTED
jgi:hypothetical protein